MNDTIVSISTALGVGAISIIRVSGKDSVNIVNKITKFKKLDKAESHTILYDFIVDNKEIIDEVLISVMLSPKTFTTEDIVEINCHGGIATTNRILELVIQNGARNALAGEFTKRAFLNGRIDLIEAEGIMDLINSETENSRKLAVNRLSGKTSNLIKTLRQKILEVIANIEVNIDYPEYDDILEITNEILVPKIDFISDEINKIIKRSENERFIKDGINVSLIGKPNVGKSSLLNALLETNKAIVTDIPGTTRDIVEGYINLDGIILNIIDTAGIRETEDIVERIGVEKSKAIINSSDLVLFLINNNEQLDEDDYKILNYLKEKKYIIVVNKIDLEGIVDLSLIEESNVVKLSVLKDQGIDELKEKIKQLFNLGAIEAKDLNYLVNSRTVALLKNCVESINDIKANIETLPIDMIEIDLKNIWNLLGLIIGETYEDELVNQLFSQFCLGK